MGKGTDKLYITHSEWASADSFSASKGAATGPSPGASFRRLPFNYCAASLQPFVHPVCTADGTIFDTEVIADWLEKHPPGTNPVDGTPLAADDLVRLHFARNDADGSGDLIDPVTFKVFTDNTHIVALRHGSYANVFAWDTVERMNIKPKMWRDLVDDVAFGRKDIITLQDPQNMAARDLSRFKHVLDGDGAVTAAQKTPRETVNHGALGRLGEKALRAKEAVDKARRERAGGGDVNRSAAAQKSAATVAKTAAAMLPPGARSARPPAYNAASFTTGRAAASFTSTGLTPETSGERAVLSDEEWMLKPRRIKIKGYARIETSLGNVNVELQTETAPKAVWNFVRLAQQGYYRDLPFHRNIRNFMIQGGDPTGTGRGGSSVWGKDFADELEGPLTHADRGVVSMANKGKNTNSSQFFITYRAAHHLDRKHSIFGRVVDGLAVLDRMEAAPVDDRDRPLQDIVIRDVVVYLDPFDEFLKEKRRTDAAEAEREDIQRRGGTDDDKVTWTGKRIRGRDDPAPAVGAGVGKYLKAALAQQKEQKEQKQAADEPELAIGDEAVWEEEPARKRAKSGGFGNFDGW